MNATITRPQPRWFHRTLKATIALVCVLVLLVGGALVYVRYQLGNISRVDIAQLDEDSGTVMNVLLVGSDSRENLTGDMAAQAGKGEVSGRRSDTIMVLHIDPRQTKAAILSIPRDLYVPIAGTNRKDRINAAFSLNGAPGLVATIESALDISINHYVEVDFVGFREIVDAVGGVQVYVPAPVRDKYSGLDIEQPGCIRFNGTQGLAWVRARHYETYESGRWRTDPTGDLGRIQRQQDFIRRMMRKAVEEGLTNPITLNRLVGIGVRDVTLDAEMSSGDIVAIARRFRSLDPATVDMLTLPTRGATVGGASVLMLQTDQARAYIDRLNGIAPPEETVDVRPIDTRVLVQNGSGADGAASGAASVLKEEGFVIAGIGDASAFNFSRTVIRHRADTRDEATLLRQRLTAGAELQERSDVPRNADVVLVVGRDYRGLGPAGTSPTTSAGPRSSAAPSGASTPAC